MKGHIIQHSLRKLKREGVFWLLIPLLAVAALAQGTHEASNLPAWLRSSISELSSTNDPTPPAPPPLDPSEQALKDLEQDTPIPVPTNLPAFYKLFSIESQVSADKTEEEANEWEEFRQASAALSTANALIREGDRRSALTELKSFLLDAKNDTPRFMVLNRLGTLYFRDEEYQQAAYYMREALQIQPSNAPMMCNLAAALLSIGEIDEALEYLEAINVEFVTSRSLVFSVFFNRTCAYSLQERTTDALENLIRAANVDPASTVASLGDTQLDFIRTDERFAKLQKTLEKFVFGKETE